MRSGDFSCCAGFEEHFRAPPPSERRPLARRSYEKTEFLVLLTDAALESGGGLFGGSKRWEYEMVFAPDFSHVEGGRVLSFKPDDSRDASAIEFGRHLHYKRMCEAKEELFSQHSALYRFKDTGWEDRGRGDAKLVKHSRTCKIRFIFVQELCRNFYTGLGLFT